MTSVQRLADSRKYYSNFFKDNLKQGKLNYSLQGKLSDSEAEDDESVDPEEKNDAIEGEEKLRGIKKPKLPQIKLSNTGRSSSRPPFKTFYKKQTSRARAASQKQARS